MATGRCADSARYASGPQKVIECPCGVVLRGADDDETIEQAQRHARENHDMTLSREQAIAMARPA